MIEKIRQAIPYEEFDYLSLMDCLKDLRQPRDRVSTLLKQGKIIRIKKGFYIFGKGYRRGSISRELLANWLYGPSYISLERALSYHGLIPERVEGLTSVCLGRSRSFHTPLGLFSYTQSPVKAYSIGIESVSIDTQRSYLMAIAEKAIIDKLRLEHSLRIRNQFSMEQYLFEDLRIDEASLRMLELGKIKQILSCFSSIKLNIFKKLITKF